MDSALRAHLLRCLRWDLDMAPLFAHSTPWAYIRRCWRGEPSEPTIMREAMERARVLGRIH